MIKPLFYTAVFLFHAVKISSSFILKQVQSYLIMLEIAESPELESSRLYSVSNKAWEITRKLFDMHVRLMQSTHGLKILRDTYEQEVHVPHSKQPGVTLESTLARNRIIEEVDENYQTGSLSREVIRRTLGVVYDDGVSMYLSFRQEDMPFLDFTEDPYTEHIIDLYASHFDAS